MTVKELSDLLKRLPAWSRELEAGFRSAFDAGVMFAGRYRQSDTGDLVLVRSGCNDSPFSVKSLIRLLTRRDRFEPRLSVGELIRLLDQTAADKGGDGTVYLMTAPGEKLRRPRAGYIPADSVRHRIVIPLC